MLTLFICCRRAYARSSYGHEHVSKSTKAVVANQSTPQISCLCDFVTVFDSEMQLAYLEIPVNSGLCVHNVSNVSTSIAKINQQYRSQKLTVARLRWCAGQLVESPSSSNNRKLPERRSNHFALLPMTTDRRPCSVCFAGPNGHTEYVYFPEVDSRHSLLSR